MEATVVNGAAKTLLNFCDSLASGEDSGVQIKIATFCRSRSSPGNAPNAFVEAVYRRGLEAFIIPERRAFDTKVTGALREVIAEYSPDIIQTNNLKSHFLVKLDGLNRGRRWIAFHHGYTATDFKVFLYNQLDRWSLPSADAIVAVCGPFRDQLVHRGVPESRIRVLHNSAAIVENPVLPTGFRASLGIGDRDRVLLTIGRLSFEKGHADLIRAVALADQSVPAQDWKLLVVGSGPEQGHLEALAAQLKIEDRLVFAGHRDDPLPFYSLADAMILPSHSEGSPHVVLEAMSAGVPIIATRVGGIPEILTDGETATLVPAQDPAAMARSLSDFLKDSRAARSRAVQARQVLQVRFSHQAYRCEMLKLYQTVLRSSD